MSWRRDLKPFPFWVRPGSQRRPALHDDASTVPSLIVTHSQLLDAVASSGSTLSAFPYPLSTFEDRSPAEGRCCLLSTGEVRVDETYKAWYHRTYVDAQLSNVVKRPLPLIPRRPRGDGFERTGRTHADGANALSGAIKRDGVYAPRTAERQAVRCGTQPPMHLAQIIRETNEEASL
jgi:hypothetical protein